VVVLFHGGVKSDTSQVPGVAEISGECHLVLFSSGNVIPHSVSNFLGGVFGLVL
jgi:hypothetical protein